MPEDRKQKTDDRKQMSENRKQMSEDRCRKTENRCQKTDVVKQIKANSKLQILNPKRGDLSFVNCILEFGIYLLFGYCDLVLKWLMHRAMEVSRSSINRKFLV
jgi:hypothetical protein